MAIPLGELNLAATPMPSVKPGAPAVPVKVVTIPAMLTTVNVVESVLAPVVNEEVAVIVVEPSATEVASPLNPAALLIVATAAEDELQITVSVMSCTVPLSYVPVAVNCRVVPWVMMAFAGITATPTSVAEVTFKAAESESVPAVAAIVVAPTDFARASPREPAVMLIVATVADDELQVTELVMSRVVLSEYVPVAINCCVVSRAMLGLAGVTAIETRVTFCAVIIKVVEAEILPNIAFMVVVPAATAVAAPA